MSSTTRTSRPPPIITPSGGDSASTRSPRELPGCWTPPRHPPDRCNWELKLSFEEVPRRQETLGTESESLFPHNAEIGAKKPDFTIPRETSRICTVRALRKLNAHARP